MFKMKRSKTTWFMVDDDTMMPVACATYEESVEVVKQIDGDMSRIYTTVK